MLFPPSNCTIAPSAKSDPGIAGAGVLLSFIITAIIALVLSASIILTDLKSPRPSTIRRKLLSSYSDQQILTGIGIQSVGLAQINALVPYHFFIIWMLSLLSTAVHNATLLALVQDYKGDRVLRWLRQGLMFANLVLGCTYGVFLLRATLVGLGSLAIPIGCAWTVKGDDPASTSDAAISVAGTIAVIAGNCAIFGLATWYLHSRSQRFYKIVQLVGVVFMAVVAAGAAIRVVLLSQAFGSPSVALVDEGEKSWSFGQLLSILMLVLPLVSVVEIVRGEAVAKAPVEKDMEA